MTTEWPTLLEAAGADTDARIIDLTTQLDAERNDNELLAESFADLALAAEDVGWQKLGMQVSQGLTRQGIGQIAVNCRVMAIASPLIKRGLTLRIVYVWGQGVEVTARNEDINAVVHDFWDDESNVASFTGSQAQEELERALGTDGNIFLAAFTNPLIGRVQVRSTPFEEVQDVITNPDDRDEPWFYLREYSATVVRPFRSALGALSTRSRLARVRVLHPAMGYWPQFRPKEIDGIPVRWDAPILHVSVNRLDGEKWGVPDAYAAISWARGYEGFLTDWARLMKALAKFAWRLSGDKSSKAQAAARKIASSIHTTPRPTAESALPQSSPVGAVAASGPGVTLEAIPKSGATIDADSGRPLASMVASGLGVSVIALLADPGVSGARATAETLDKPTVLEAGMRRKLWSWAIRTILQYAVLQAVKAPQGPLAGIGRVAYNSAGRQTVVFPDDVDPTIEIDWPKLDDLDPKTLIEAIAKADETGKMPPVTTMKLLLQALGVKDVDDLIEDFTDDDGNWVDPLVTAGQAAADAFNDGRDPAGVVR